MMRERIIVRDYVSLKRLRDSLKKARYVAYDTETTGLNPRKDRVIGFSICSQTGVAYYVPIWEWDGLQLKRAAPDNQPDSVIHEILETLLTKRLIMHNSSFDVRMTLGSFGIDLTPALYADTVLLKHTCDEEEPFGLKDIAVLIQDKLGFDAATEANEEQKALKEHLASRGAHTAKGNYELYKGDTDVVGLYAAADADLTLRLFHHYNQQLFAEGLDQFFYKDEVMPLLKEVTIPMETRGVPINVELLHQLKDDIASEISKLEQQVQSLVAPHLDRFTAWYLNKEFPVKLSGDFPRALAEHLGADLPRTESGQVSLAAKHLAASNCHQLKSFIAGFTRLDEPTIRAVQLRMYKEKHNSAYMFNLKSKHHLKKLFFETLKDEPISRTEKGNPQIDDEFLESVKDKYDFVPLLIQYNKLCKIEGSYIDRFLKKHEDGVFYPSFQQHDTISGRYGSDLQQLPRPIEGDDVVARFNNRIRELFISGPGYVFIDDDYESLEPHIFAHVSGDERLRDIFRNPDLDFYSTIAIPTEGLDGYSANKKDENYLGKVAKQRRQRAKAYSLGIPYGMSGYKLSFELDCSVQEADALVERYLDSFPELRRWMQRSRDQVLKTGMIRTEAGRVRRYKRALELMKEYGDKPYDITDPLSISRYFRKGSQYYETVRADYKTLRNYLNNACNFQIQSLGASIVNRACIKIMRFIKEQGLDAYVCAQIHDQIIVRCKEEDSDLLKSAVQNIMENVYPLSVPLKAPAAVGRNFKEAH